MGIHVFFFGGGGGAFFFSHARIGLPVEPGRETEKLIIVPSCKHACMFPKKKSGNFSIRYKPLFNTVGCELAHKHAYDWLSVHCVFLIFFSVYSCCVADLN